jgi:hypothetical protein
MNRDIELEKEIENHTGDISHFCELEAELKGRKEKETEMLDEFIEWIKILKDNFSGKLHGNVTYVGNFNDIKDKLRELQKRKEELK